MQLHCTFLNPPVFTYLRSCFQLTGGLEHLRNSATELHPVIYPSVCCETNGINNKTPAHFASSPFAYLSLYSMVSPRLPVYHFIQCTPICSSHTRPRTQLLTLSLLLFFAIYLCLCASDWCSSDPCSMHTVLWFWAPVPQQSRTTSQRANTGNTVAYVDSETQKDGGIDL